MADVKYPVETITFKGREIQVRLPSPEQLLVWRRTMRSLQAANPEDWSSDEVLDALERTRRIVDSLLDKETIRWIDDEMLSRNIGLQDLSEIILEATRVFGKHETPGKKPAKTAAKKPAKKATRKAV
jgi:hypothetical protein